jgi:HD superfamily phosphohydrolase
VERILLGRKSEFDHEDHVIFSFLNSSLDARVIDFVRRDSLHLGINEGNAVDLDELLPHLTINNHKLALRMTGVTVAEQIISLRYWLFNRIYWCRPNRGFVAMVRFLMMELLEDNAAVTRMRDVILKLDQREFLAVLYEEAKRACRPELIELADLLTREQQNLYRVVFDVSPAEAQMLRPAWKQLDQMTHQELKAIGQSLAANVLPDSYREKVAGLFPLLIDLPQEPGATKLGDDIMVIGRNEYPVGLLDISGIVKGVNDSFNNHLRRLRVFAHPNLVPDKQADKKHIEDGIMQYLVKHHT